MLVARSNGALAGGKVIRANPVVRESQVIGGAKASPGSVHQHNGACLIEEGDVRGKSVKRSLEKFRRWS